MRISSSVSLFLCIRRLFSSPDALALFPQKSLLRKFPVAFRLTGRKAIVSRPCPHHRTKARHGQEVSSFPFGGMRYHSVLLESECRLWQQAISLPASDIQILNMGIFSMNSRRGSPCSREDRPRRCILHFYRHNAGFRFMVVSQLLKSILELYGVGSLAGTELIHQLSLSDRINIIVLAALGDPVRGCARKRPPPQGFINDKGQKQVRMGSSTSASAMMIIFPYRSFVRSNSSPMPPRAPATGMSFFIAVNLIQPGFSTLASCPKGRMAWNPDPARPWQKASCRIALHDVDLVIGLRLWQSPTRAGPHFQADFRRTSSWPFWPLLVAREAARALSKIALATAGFSSEYTESFSPTKLFTRDAISVLPVSFGLALGGRPYLDADDHRQSPSRTSSRKGSCRFRPNIIFPGVIVHDPGEGPLKPSSWVPPSTVWILLAKLSISSL